MIPKDLLLVELLAGQDAIWAPLRKPAWDSQYAAGALYFARRDFPTAGVRWASGEAEEVQRKRAQRLVETLAAKALVRLFASSGRTLGVYLTDAGEWQARALARLPTLKDCHAQMQALVKFGRKVWVNECVIWTGRKNANYPKSITGKTLWKCQAKFYPGLTRELVVAGSDLQGRTYYSATDAGIKWAAGPRPKAPSGLPAADEEAAVFYWQTWQARRADFRTQVPGNTREIGLPPLPVGCPLIRAADGASDPPRRRKGGRQAE